MDALLAYALAQTAAEEGRRIIIAMLIVGLVFIAVAAGGETWHYVRHLRHRRRS